MTMCKLDCGCTRVSENMFSSGSVPLQVALFPPTPRVQHLAGVPPDANSYLIQETNTSMQQEDAYVYSMHVKVHVKHFETIDLKLNVETDVTSALQQTVCPDTRHRWLTSVL